MRPTFAIAFLAMRAAIRSRLVIALLVLLALAVLALPPAVKGDGTLNGKVRLLLHYSLGLSGMLLGAATLWAACGAVSQEIEEKQIRLVAVKPVPPACIWLGKWLGLLALNACLLGLAGALTYVFLLWLTRPSSASPQERQILQAEVLTTRRLIHPQADIAADEARARLAEFERAGRLPPEISRAQALAELERQILAEKQVVPPGGTRPWVFRPPHGRWPRPAPDAPLVLRVRLSSSFAMEKQPVTGTWLLQQESGAALCTLPMESALDGMHRLPLPAAALPDGELLVVRFVNAGRDRSNTVIFDRDAAVEILAPASCFAANFARALLVLWCYLALLAALGLTAGTLFSFPVAAFVAGAALTMAVSAHYFTFAAGGGGEPHHHGEHPEHAEPKAQILRRAGERIGRGMEFVARPVLDFAPLEALADGVLLPWSVTARAVGILALAYPGALWALGTFLLSRRELAPTP